MKGTVTMSSGNTPNAPSRVEVPAQKVEVKITIDDLLSALAEQARILARAAPGPSAGVRDARQPDSDVARRLSSLSDLATALKDEVDELRRLDPSVIDRLQQGAGRT